jgi:hypothetical protein
MKLESFHSEEDKALWKIVRTDDFSELPGKIISACDITGDCCMSYNGASQSFSLGAGGLKIVPAGRR